MSKKRKDKSKPPPQHVSDWSVFGVYDNATWAAIADQPWGEAWVFDMLVGNRLCMCCDNELGVPASSTRQPPAIVAASIMPFGKKGKPKWVLVSMCAVCALKHPSPVAASEVLLLEAVAKLGSTESRILQHSAIWPDTVQ